MQTPPFLQESLSNPYRGLQFFPFSPKFSSINNTLIFKVWFPQLPVSESPRMLVKKVDSQVPPQPTNQYIWGGWGKRVLRIYSFNKYFKRLIYMLKGNQRPSKLSLSVSVCHSRPALPHPTGCFSRLVSHIATHPPGTAVMQWFMVSRTHPVLSCLCAFAHAAPTASCSPLTPTPAVILFLKSTNKMLF